MPIVSVIKPFGWTPLQVLDWLRVARREWHGEAMTYAGRLDPMADGVLLVLVGEDRYKKPELIRLEKTYVSEMLLGVETDCYDVLGLVKRLHSTEELDPVSLKALVEHCVGDHELPFPPFSAYKVNGAPLHYWARQGKLDEIEIPKKVMSVKTVEYLGHRMISRSEVRREVLERIPKARGAFRQEETEKSWRDALAQSEGDFLSVRVRCRVGSGTYIRALAHKLGRDLGTGAILWSLRREAVGGYGIEEAMKIDV